MQALKTLVILMGLLIVTGVIVLVYGLMTRVSEEEAAERPREAIETTLPMPAGCVIAEARSENGRLIMRGDGPAERGCQQVIVLDPDSGKVLSRITVTPEP